MESNLPVYGDSEIIMFYNVENLFTADTKPLRRHLPSVSGLRNWNGWRYSDKLLKISSVFSLVQNSYGKLPAIIGLSEVQGRQPVQALADSQPLSGRYEIVHYESMDERGVDVALLYDKMKLTLTASEPISFIFEIADGDPANYDTTRDVLHCTFRLADGASMHVFVLHLPSKRDKDVNKPKRDYMMAEMRNRVINLVKDKNEAAILMGDFNENPDDENLNKLLYDDQGNKFIDNPFYNLFLQKDFSTFHADEGLLFDQILLSRQFERKNFPLQFAGAEVFKPAQIASRDRRFAGKPFRTYAGTRYLGGYSDHFPVLVKFNKYKL